MANYALTNGSGTQQPTAAAYTGALLGVTAGTPGGRRIKVYDVLIGTNGLPADNFVEWSIDRVTTGSSATVVVPNPLDTADAPAVAVCTANSSTGGTVVATGQVFYVGVNQRASYRWVAAPGSELVSPAVAASGFQLRIRSGGYLGTATGTLLFQEQ